MTLLVPFSYPAQEAQLDDELLLLHEAGRVLLPNGIFRLLVSNSVAQYPAGLPAFAQYGRAKATADRFPEWCRTRCPADTSRVGVG